MTNEKYYGKSSFNDDVTFYGNVTFGSETNLNFGTNNELNVNKISSESVSVASSIAVGTGSSSILITAVSSGSTITVGSAVTITSKSQPPQSSDIAVSVTGIVTATSFSGNGTIPVGGIIMWSGTIANIPTGWALCNGSNGTPDLRNRFIAGAGTDTLSVWGFNITTGAVTFSGGQSFVGVSSTGGSVATRVNSGSNTEGINATASIPDATFLQQWVENRPPYYALAFIMRIS